MYIRRVWKKDRIAAIILVAMLSFYLLLHLVKLEIFPFYLFPMYSLPKEPGQEQVVYSIKDKYGKELDLSSMVYRRFVYIHNTLKAYDEVLESEHQRPNVIVVEKFVQRLAMQDNYLGKGLLDQYTVDKVDQKMQAWLSSVLDTEGPFQIDKCFYHWEGAKLKKNLCKTISR